MSVMAKPAAAGVIVGPSMMAGNSGGRACLPRFATSVPIAYDEEHPPGVPTQEAFLPDAVTGLTVLTAAERIDMSYPAANNAVSRLVDDGVLRQVGEKERNQEFVAADIMAIVEINAEDLPRPSEVLRLRTVRWSNLERD
jgi:hypothetical protein